MNNHQFLQGDSDKPVVLLMHSLSDSGEIMREVVQGIHSAGYSVYFPDFSGHGTGSYTDLFEVGIADWNQDGERFLEDLHQAGYENQDIVVGGLSLGGLVAVELAMQHPDLRGLISLATPILVDLKETRIALYIRQQYYQSLDHDPTAEDRELANEYFKRFDDQLTEMNEWMEEIFPHLFELEHATFIGQCQNDEVISAKVAERFKRSLRKADPLTFKHYEEGSHYMIIGPTRDILIGDLITYLDAI